MSIFDVLLLSAGVSVVLFLLGHYVGVWKWLKSRLSTINQASWHYRMSSRIWRDAKAPRTRKACFYWLVRFPLSLLVTGIGAIVMVPLVIGVGCAFLVASGLFLFGAYLCGFTLGAVKAVNPGRDRGEKDFLFYRYKYSPRKDRQKRFAAYQFIGPVLAVWLVWWMSGLIGDHLGGTLLIIRWSGIVVLGSAVLIGIGALVYWRRGKLAELWDRACPTITYVPAARKPDRASA